VWRDRWSANEFADTNYKAGTSLTSPVTESVVFIARISIACHTQSRFVSSLSHINVETHFILQVVYCWSPTAEGGDGTGQAASQRHNNQTLCRCTTIGDRQSHQSQSAVSRSSRCKTTDKQRRPYQRLHADATREIAKQYCTPHAATPR